MGNWWLTALSWQGACSCIGSHTVFGETSNHPGDSAPLQPRFGALWLLAFPKTKIIFEREDISDCLWDSGKYEGQLMVTGRTVWGPKVPILKGTEVSLSHVQCFLYLVCLINVFIFHSTCLDTFWAGLVCMLCKQLTLVFLPRLKENFKSIYIRVLVHWKAIGI